MADHRGNDTQIRRVPDEHVREIVVVDTLKARIRDHEATIAALRAEIERREKARAETMLELAALRAERDEARLALEADRSAVAGVVSRTRKVVNGYSHLLEGRGSHEYDDDRWRDEFRGAAEEMKAAIEPLVKIAADWTNCPADQAGIMLARRAEAAEAQVQAMREVVEAARKYRLLLLDPEPGLASWNIALKDATERVDAALATLQPTP